MCLYTSTAPTSFKLSLPDFAFYKPAKYSTHCFSTCPSVSNPQIIASGQQKLHKTSVKWIALLFRVASQYMPLNRKLCTPLLGTYNLLFYDINKGGGGGADQVHSCKCGNNLSSPHLHSNGVSIHTQPQDRTCRFSQNLCNTAKMVHTVLNLMCIKLESVHGTNMHTLDAVITSQKFINYALQCLLWHAAKTNL